jgi:hypothetical protein
MKASGVKRQKELAKKLAKKRAEEAACLAATAEAEKKVPHL